MSEENERFAVTKDGSTIGWLQKQQNGLWIVQNTQREDVAFNMPSIVSCEEYLALATKREVL